MLNAHFQPPPALHPRDRVAVIAPASAFDRPSFEAGPAPLPPRHPPPPRPRGFSPPPLPAARPPSPPKLLVGFSDITALPLGLQTLGRISVHGPVLTQRGRLPPAPCERLFSVRESPPPAPPLKGTLTCVGGVAEGPLLGGN